jgi:aspartyl-tRNA(Asn)/glutamyl-tRNA(Gln) amidotransferase subunit A
MECESDAMSSPWTGDSCSLVDAFRAKALSPLEALEDCLAAIAASELNAFSHVAADEARATARTADVSLPFGGVPLGVKELTAVAGWPDTEACVAFKDRVADHDATMVNRLRAAGGVLTGLTTASEFGGINVTFTKLNGPSRNPWDETKNPGGSSGGSAAAVAGGLVPIATGGDGGGSIRIPAAFCGLPGLKATYGRIPKGPPAEIGNVSSVSGCLSRSIRDIARWFDVCNGHHPGDPLSLPRVEGWEAGLGSHVEELRGLRVVIAPTLGNAVIHPDVEANVREWAEMLVKLAGLQVVDVPIAIEPMDTTWAITGLAGTAATLGDAYPACAEDLTPQIKFGMELASRLTTFEAVTSNEIGRRRFTEVMWKLFEQVDLVICATNPDTAFGAKGPMPQEVNGQHVPAGNNGALTIPANLYGNPGLSIPAGVAAGTGLPVGVQVMGRHHTEPLLLDLGLLAERERPWPLVAPGSPI